METPIRYLEFAVKCNGLAKQVNTVEDRTILEEMAEAWKKVAREVDRNRKADSKESSGKGIWLQPAGPFSLSPSSAMAREK